MKRFKFFQQVRVARTELGFVRLKDVFNRNKVLLCNWSEYPYDGDDSQIRTYQGNILEFYNYLEREQLHPTIYEIQKQHRGYISSSLVYGNRNRYNEFIKRKFYLTIRYTVM